MYCDNSLMPKEAIRLAVLGTLTSGLGSLRYADLAGAIRHFTSRIVGPSLDLMGTSLGFAALRRFDPGPGRHRHGRQCRADGHSSR